MIGLYELNDKETLMWTGLTQTELDDAKAKLQKDGKFKFFKGWVKVMNHNKYNSYGTGEKQEAALAREVSNIPQDVSDYMSSDTSIDTSMHTTGILDIKHNTENIKHKSLGKSENPFYEEAQKFLDAFNEIFQTKYKSTRSWAKNFSYWRGTYSLDEVIEAVRKAKNHPFYKDKLNPDMLLRTHEDRIGQFLNNRKESLIL